MSRKSNHWKVTFCVSGLVLACAGSQPSAATPAPSAAPSVATPAAPPPQPPAPSAAPAASAAAAPAASAEPAPVKWKDMKPEQRKEFMKSVVLPKMKEEFVAFNAHAYGEMNCVTCHGDSAKDGSFKMPNPKLPKLPADEAGFKKLMKKKPEATKFMSSKVVPSMAEMVGESPYNPETKQGFGCFECHTKN
jgi:hypothetical protein